MARLIFEINAADSPEARHIVEQQVGGYIIEKELGRGGFGAVYRARRAKDQQRVAVKVMLPRAAVDQTSIDKFLREIRSTATLRHPHIVPVLDVGSSEGIFYFVMEYCAGRSLDYLMAAHGGRLSLELAGPIILQTLEGLAFAHEQGIVHRDLKPQNILLSSATHPILAKIADFGLAKHFAKAGFSGLTLTGTYAGTPLFLPREQIINFKYAKPVSDIWSMGATIYHLLTAQFPYELTRDRDPIDIILHEPVVPVRRRDASIPKPLAAVIDKAIAVNPTDRYQNGGEMLEAFKKAL